VDYQIFCSDEVADTIRFFAKAVRETVGDKRLVGAAYGHIFDLAASRCGVQNGGQLALGPICEAPELNFLVSGGTYGDPNGPPQITTANSSVTGHDKAWITMTPEQQGSGASVLGLAGGGLVAQEGYAPEKWPTPTRTLPAQLDRGSVAEIAVIIDDISAAYTACGPELLKPLLSDQRVSLSLLGAPFDVWTLDDFMAQRASGYKLYVFLDCFYLDSQWRKQLTELLQAQKCAALWIYAPGAIDNAIGGRTMKDLTGLTLVQRIERGLLQVKVDGAGGYGYGAPIALTPRFVCVDDQAEVRGRLAGTDYAGLATKQWDNVKEIWSAAPHLPASLLRALATEADVHMWGDAGDGVYANQSLIVVRAGNDGEHVVRLPKLAQAYDLSDGKPVGKKASQFSVTLKAGQIGIYYYGEAPLVVR
jgi:hypothetical protein